MSDQTVPSINLPWVEKYRPNKLEDLISHEEIINTIKKFLKEGRLPHLLLYGPPGTGKTSTILSIAKQLYSPAHIKSMVLELNASDERGIDVVRQRILDFAGLRSVFGSGFKLIILDEADAMTSDAQNALRRIVEKYTENVRFCLICNYLSKIIPALQSRCTRFRFGPLSKSQILPRLNYVIEQEKLNVTDDGRKALIKLGNGDMRKVINLLQSTSMAHDVVDEDNVYICCGQPKKEDIRMVIESLVNDSFDECYRKVSHLQRSRGIALQDVITQLHLLVHKFDLTNNIKINILEKMSNIEYQLSFGGLEKIQLQALIGSFQEARDCRVAAN